MAAALSGWLASEIAPRDVLVGGAAGIALTALVVSLIFVRDTADHVRLEQRDHDRKEQLRLSGRSSPRPRTAGRLCVRARRPGWSTTSTTRSRGDSYRCSLPHTAPRRLRSGSWRALPGVWGVGQIFAGGWSDRIGASR